MSLCNFWGLKTNCVFNGWSKIERRKKTKKKTVDLCSGDEWTSCGFGKAWGWVEISFLCRLHLHLVIWQTLLSKATEEVLVTPSLSHCSNKYKLAREGEKDKGKVLFFFFFRTSLGWSQVVLKEMSFQLLLEDWQGSSIPDRGGKIIPPSRNGEWECSGEWFWASLWWYHKASLTSRSQTSGGDVDS